MSHLTNNQRNTLLTAVKADPTAGPLRAVGNVTGLQAWLNTAASPAALAWVEEVPILNADEAPSYATYDTLAQGKRDSWVRFLAFPRNFSRNKVRGWIVDVWGNATSGSNAEAVLQAGTENATNAQVMLGGTTRATGTVSALDRNYAEPVDTADVEWLCQQP